MKSKNYLLRHIQVMLASLGQLWRQPLATLMTILVIAIGLSLPAGLYVLLQNMNAVSDQWDDANQISLFLNKHVSDRQAKHLAGQLKSWPSIQKISTQSSVQSLEEFQQSSGLGNLLDSLPENPLPAVLIIEPKPDYIKPTLMEDLLERLQELPQVEYAQLDMEWLQRLRSINKTIERGIAVLSTLLSLSVLLIIGNTIRLAILNRQSEIQVMKLVGATDRFVRRPFLYTGFWYGLLSGLLAWFILMLAISLISTPIQDIISLYDSDFSLQWFSGYLFFNLPLISVSLGIAGAWLAVSRHIHAIEPT